MDQSGLCRCHRAEHEERDNALGAETSLGPRARRMRKMSSAMTDPSSGSTGFGAISTDFGAMSPRILTRNSWTLARHGPNLGLGIPAPVERPRKAERERERGALPESCRTIACHALPSYPGDPGELHNCPALADQLLQSCRRVAPGAEVRHKFWLMWADCWPTSANIDQHLENSDRTWSLLAKSWPISTHIGRTSTKTGPHCPNVAQSRPTSTKLWSTSAKSGQNLPTFGHMRPTSATMWPRVATLRQRRSNFTTTLRISAPSTTLRQLRSNCSATVGQILGNWGARRGRQGQLSGTHCEQLFRDLFLRAMLCLSKDAANTNLGRSRPGLACSREHAARDSGATKAVEQ